MKFILKDASVEAVCYTGEKDSALAIQQLINQSIGLHEQKVSDAPALTITAIDGVQACIKGDWVVKLPSGGVRVVSASRFAAEYEEVK